MDGHDPKHLWLMVLACAVPLLLVFVLPLFGFRGNLAWIAIGLMVLLHVWMMKGHGGHGQHSGKEGDDPSSASRGSRSTTTRPPKEDDAHACH